MTATRRLAVFAIVLCAALAVGSGTVGATELECDEDGPTVVGNVGEDWTADDVTLYEGSAFDLAYCSNDRAYTSDWLDENSDDGFTAERTSGEGSDAVVYTVSLTGDGPDEIDFADHVTIDSDEADGLTAEVVATDDTDALERFNDTDGGVEGINRYRNSRASLAEAMDALENETAAIESGNADPAGATDELERLDSAYGNMTDRENALIGELLTETGESSGAMAAIASVRTNASAQRNAADAAIDHYRETVATERSEARSTVRLATFGSLAAGLAVGAAAGVVVPLVAARRVEEEMKLSRTASYDRKTALFPILVGIVLAIVGAAVLMVVIGPELLEVIR